MLRVFADELDLRRASRTIKISLRQAEDIAAELQ
jgi:hypothetical protein